MDWPSFFKIFSVIFLAELGDKTQIAALLFAAREDSKWTVFLAAAAALVASSALAVVAGSALSKVLTPQILSWIGGIGFMAIGAWMIRSGTTQS
ncbi:MAG: hypothetical protein CMJ89_06920 [Planctomycetes bacterium]|jgi:putative Ca2+/H+ antiporter (TMEM165/GDT1 family)|nr:hypothetical protein [Planctomycetota bacterium]